ncbi:MAG: YcgL domain-containing protein [Pseudomonadota bacterium]|nr:YcgL domain-containing protein [Pseudomonadota bacterium]
MYKSSRKPGVYLYLTDKEGFSNVPESLLDLFGKTELVLEFDLTPERKLARVDALEVLGSIEQYGYYMQMPPANDRPV